MVSGFMPLNYLISNPVNIHTTGMRNHLGLTDIGNLKTVRHMIPYIAWWILGWRGSPKKTCNSPRLGLLKNFTIRLSK